MRSNNEFTIVAGPNGAGKSLFAENYIRPGTKYFNGDLIFAELSEKYPHLSREQLEGGVAGSLEYTIENAIKNRIDFAFETTVRIVGVEKCNMKY